MSLDAIVEVIYMDQDGISVFDEQIAKNLNDQNDKLNWTTLCKILDRFYDQVEIIEHTIDVLKGLSNRFSYIASSLESLKAQLKALRTTPIQLSEQSDSGSWISKNSNRKSWLPYDPEDEISKKTFLPSVTYDWSKTEKSIQSVEEIISMAGLMAIYEIVDTDRISDDDFDEMFYHPILSDWNGSTNEALFEVLRYLSQHVEATYSYSSKQALDRQRGQEAGGGKVETTATIQDKPPQQQYPSTKLNTERHEIRLLELLPGLDDQPIEGLLSIASLDDTPIYEALSYAWGNSLISKTIQLNQTKFAVTSNLQTALFHLRKEKTSRMLWVDAICINQDDPEEKLHQIQLMTKIYPDAQTVLCWLGPEEDNSSFVINYIQRAADTIGASDDESASDNESSTGNDRSLSKESESEESEEFLNDLFKLLSRPWWSRLWTCQEFALTLREPYLICGNQRISLSIFHRVLERKIVQVTTAVLHSSDLELNTATYWKNNGKLIHVARIVSLWTHQGPSFSLLNGRNIHLLFGVIYHTRYYQCTDPRDKIFAVLSFLEEPHRALFPPNYRQTVEMIYTRFTAAALVVGRAGALYKSFSVANKDGKALSSWVVDYASQTLDGSYDPTYFHGNHPINVSKNMKLQCLPIGKRLLIRGVLFDPVCTAWKVLEGDEVNIPNFYAHLSELCSKSQIASRINLNKEDPAYLIQHLRTKDDFFDVVTSGICNEAEFERTFEKRNRSKDEKPYIASRTLRARKGETDVNYHTGAPSSFSHEKEGDSKSCSSSLNSGEVEELDAEAFALMIHSVTGRTIFTTVSGFFGIGVKGIEKGDLVAILFGISIPFVLRKCGDHYKFVGGSRIGGIMHGELMEFLDNGTFQARSFCIW